MYLQKKVYVSASYTRLQLTSRHKLLRFGTLRTYDTFNETRKGQNSQRLRRFGEKAIPNRHDD